LAQLSKYKDHSDAQLINNFLESGNTIFVGELYKRYGHLVLGLCIKYLKDKDEAEDAVMTIFGQLLNDLKKHKVEYFKSWLYTYSKNYCLMQLRKKQNQLKKELDVKENEVFLMDYNNIEHLNEKEQQISLMQSALNELNKEQKICLELFYLNNKSYTEIVTITGYNNNEVKSHIQNGKRNLKIKMESLQNGQANR
jgi:RNA polymerase sigma factor (sigma-70 family)